MWMRNRRGAGRIPNGRAGVGRNRPRVRTGLNRVDAAGRRVEGSPPVRAGTVAASMDNAPPPPVPPPDARFMVPVEVPARRVWWGIGDFFFAWLGGFIASTVAGAAYVALVVGADTARIGENVGFLATVIVAQNVGIVAVLAGIARWKGTGTLADFGWRWRIAARDLPWVLVGAGLQIAFTILLVPINVVMGKAQAQNVVSAFEKGQGNWLAATVFLAAVVTLAPFAEEILYRGLLLRSLQRRVRPGRAVAVSAVAFALTHVLGDPSLGSVVALPALFAVGALAGMRAVRTGSITQSVCVHLGFNLVTAIALSVTALAR